jgi:signal transduction histidine kinase
MALRSMRARMLLGSLLWTAVLLPVAHLVGMALAHHAAMRSGWALHWSILTSLAIAVIAGAALQFRQSLVPFRKLRTRLTAVREGRDRRIEGDYPTEVQPLVDDLNDLLDQREKTVARALQKAGDFAHGLKTPLAVLAREAERAAHAGHLELAATLAQEVERMRRQVERHLVHARAAVSNASPAARCSVGEALEGLCRALRRLHADRGVSIEVRSSSEHVVRGQLEDVDEMLGNLLDNACRWARSKVVATSTAGERSVVIDVDDDGPGIAAPMREAMLQRGVRADEAASGSGLGLAIVRELAELYGGSIALAESPLGGLRARLELPR